ncbi:hypothetical protein EZS27_030324 [termite gut metagenome]|uniref:Uncharacterized protein n=1 Tax=termite gut metagenome TaxID=433724 RepID=A0A5J4QGA4_9ZZZZ
MGTIWEQFYIFAATQKSIDYESFCIYTKDGEEK